MNETEPIEADIRRVESESLGWRCVWLPKQQHFLAYMDVEMPNGARPPTAVAATAPALLGEIRAHMKLRHLIKEYLDLKGTT